MPDVIPNPGLTFDEALILDAAIKLSADADLRFKSDAVLDSARQKLWRAAMALHGQNPAVYDAAVKRFDMRQRLTGRLDDPNT